MDYENESLLRPGGQNHPKKEDKTRRYSALIVVGILTGAYSISEIVISRYLDSVALLSDGVHNLSDVISLIIAFAALMKSTSRKKDEFTYGWKRTEILGAVLNGAFLMSLALYIVIEAIPKFFTNGCDDLDKLSSSWVYVATAAAGLSINTLGTILFCLLSGGHGHVHAGGGDHGHSHGEKKHKKHGHSHGHDHEEEKPRKNNMPKTIVLDDVLEHKSLLEDDDEYHKDTEKAHDHEHKHKDHDHKHKDHDHKHKDHDHDHDHEHKHKHKDHDHKHKDHDHEHKHKDHDHEHKHKHKDHDHDHDGHGHEHKHKHKDHDHDHKHKDHDHDHDDHGHGDHDDGKDMNIHAVFLHYLGDALSSVLLVVTGLLVKYFPDQTWTRYLDPVASLLIVILILWTTVPLLKRCSNILLQQTPSSIKIPKLHKKLSKIEGIRSVHDLHVWQLVDSMVIASLHIRLSDYDSKKFQIVSTKVKQVLHDFGVHSITIQPEFSVSPNQSKTCDQNCIAECEEDWCCIDDQPIVQTT